MKPLRINKRYHITNETLQKQLKADCVKVNKSDLRYAINNSSYIGFIDDYCKLHGTPYKKLKADQLNTMLYALAWCQTWSKTPVQWFTAPWNL